MFEWIKLQANVLRSAEGVRVVEKNQDQPAPINAPERSEEGFIRS